MVQKHSATITKPQIAPIDDTTRAHSKTVDQDAAELSSLFMSMAIEMSWQLAAVVVIPIGAGYLLDSHLNTTPWCVLVGLVIAAVGVGVILRRVVIESNRRIGSGTPKGTA